MALLVPGCDGLFGLVEVTPELDALIPDASAEPPQGCVAGRAPDGFDNSVPCAPWGTLSTNGAVASIGSSQLRIAVNADMGKAFCTELAAAPLADTGIVAEVSLIQGDAWFGVTNGPAALYIYAGFGVLKLTTVGINYATVAYDPQLMRWWRLRIDRASLRWAADYSSNSQSWTTLGTSDLFPVDVSVQIELGAGAGATTPPLVNTFDAINVCGD